MNKTDIINVLTTIIHPEYDKSIVELGYVKNIKIEGSNIEIDLEFPRRDPLARSLSDSCRRKVLEAFAGTDVRIGSLYKDAPKPQEKSIVLEPMEGVDKIIAIASGKGGVGKSTVAVNLAVSLAKQGYSVGLLDADIYGPSIPKMTGTEGCLPEVVQVPSPLAERDPAAYEDPSNEHYHEKRDLIVPLQKFGIKIISVGYLIPPESALVWRGPLASRALKQLLFDVSWGELDYLLIDLPPGTGDIQISLIQSVKLTGAIIVTTPQAVALADVEKAINMFGSKGVECPVLGVVENMSWFTPAELPDNKYYIFGKEGGRRIAAKHNVPLLAQIPLIQSVMEGSDEGSPSVINNDNPLSPIFEEICSKI